MSVRGIDKVSLHSHGVHWADLELRGNWKRVAVYDFDRWRLFYYWRGVRVPWLAWVMFS